MEWISYLICLLILLSILFPILILEFSKFFATKNSSLSCTSERCDIDSVLESIIRCLPHLTYSDNFSVLFLIDLTQICQNLHSWDSQLYHKIKIRTLYCFEKWGWFLHFVISELIQLLKMINILLLDFQLHFSSGYSVNGLKFVVYRLKNLFIVN